MKPHLFTKALVCTVLPILAIAIMTGCSGPPSESDGRKLIQQRIENQSEGKIKLVSFRKTNAIGSDSLYKLEYEAEIEFLETGAWAQGTPFDTLPSFKFTPGKGVWSFLPGSIQTVREGERKTLRGSFVFEKTERGWRGPDGNVY